MSCLVSSAKVAGICRTSPLKAIGKRGKLVSKQHLGTPVPNQPLAARRQHVPRVAQLTAGEVGPEPLLLPPAPPLPAHEVLKKFFHAFNVRDLEGWLDLLADDMVHHDLAYPHVYRGKEAVTNFYMDFLKDSPADLKFILEEWSEGDSQKCGAIWHMELGGAEVPGSKGVSFYKTNAEGRIVFIRESPEHFVKVAPLLMAGLGATAPLLGPAMKQVVPLMEDLSGVLDNLPFPGAKGKRF